MKKLKFEKAAKERSFNIFIKLLLGLMLFSLLFTIIYLSIGPTVIRLYEGDISLKDIYAPYDFTYTGDLDEARTEEAKEEALKSIAPVYIINPQIKEEISKRLSLLFEQTIASRKTAEMIGDDEKLKRLKGASTLNLSDQTYLSLIRADDMDYLQKAINERIDSSLRTGILSAADKDSLIKEDIKTVAVLDPATGTKVSQSVKSMPTLNEFLKEVEKSLSEDFPENKKLRNSALEVIKTLISSNLEFSPEETQKERDEALADLPKFYKKITVKKNELLIGRGERVAKRHLKILTQLGKMRELGGRIFHLIGMAALLLIFLLISVFHLKFYEHKIFLNNKNLILISIMAIFIVIAAEGVIASPLSSYLIPLSSASMLLAILLGAHTAFIFTVIMSIFTGVIAGNNFGLMIVMFVGSFVGIYSTRKVRRRSKLLLAGVMVGLANFLTINALNLINNLNPRLFLTEGLWGFVNGLVSFLLVIGLLPVLEHLFKIPTDITLLELSDLNHPLLKEMATNAPGTYHHSIIVGNLAEAACDAIGANSLLARVGAYYHDIGKTEKAEYFSENMPEPTKNSRHDIIAPSMSALVIINHVKDGVELARKYKLNQALVDFIAQHHGNGLIYYFYQRALEKADDEKKVKEEEFRYPGPRPQSKEAAIVLLSDSVEASSRTLLNPTPSRVQALVQRIVNNKFIDGQLDECDLTLKEVHKISESFTRVLNAMFHTRVEYPKEDERHRFKNNHKKSDQKTNSENLFNKEDDKGSS